MALIVSGKALETRRFQSKNWKDDEHFQLNEFNRAPRPQGMWVRGIVLHTTHGTSPQPILPGKGNAGGALANIKYWNSLANTSHANHKNNYASAHLLVDRDATVIQAADLSEQTWHATSVNPVTIGIEVVQGSDGSLYEDQIKSTVAMLS